MARKRPAKPTKKPAMPTKNPDIPMRKPDIPTMNTKKPGAVTRMRLPKRDMPTAMPQHASMGRKRSMNEEEYRKLIEEIESN